MQKTDNKITLPSVYNISESLEKNLSNEKNISTDDDLSK
jgi:hypothetical protein